MKKLLALFGTMLFLMGISAQADVAGSGATTVSDGTITVDYVVKGFSLKQDGDWTTYIGEVGTTVLALIFTPAEGRKCGKISAPDGYSQSTLLSTGGTMCIWYIDHIPTKGKGVTATFRTDEFWATDAIAIVQFEGKPTDSVKLSGLPVKAEPPKKTTMTITQIVNGKPVEVEVSLDPS